MPKREYRKAVSASHFGLGTGEAWILDRFATLALHEGGLGKEFRPHDAIPEGQKEAAHFCESAVFAIRIETIDLCTGSLIAKGLVEGTGEGRARLTEKGEGVWRGMRGEKQAIAAAHRAGMKNHASGGEGGER